jgi:hypothetical protein
MWRRKIFLKKCAWPPVREPLRRLVHTAAERTVRDVCVDGIAVAKNHEVITLNHADPLGRLAEAQVRMEAAVSLR